MNTNEIKQKYKSMSKISMILKNTEQIIGKTHHLTNN